MASTLRSANRYWVFALCLLLGGCGFQLRGTSPVPDAIQPLALSCAAQVPDRVCRAVTDQLDLGKVKQAKPSDAKVIVELKSFRQEIRANAVTAQGAAAEYTLRQSVDVAVLSGDQMPLLAPETVTSAKTYRYDETNVLAKRREEAELQESLSQNLAQQILFRLAPLNQTKLDILRQQSTSPDNQSAP